MIRRAALLLVPLGLLLASPASALAITVNESFHPQDEFKVEEWIPIHLGGLDLSINRVVLYLFLAAVLTVGTMWLVAKRMHARPNRIQTAVEFAYTGARDNLTASNMDPKMARKWFPFVCALLMFIWFSNMLGYIPLPTNSAEPFHLFGAKIPAFAFYAATANISVPLALTLMVWILYHFEGIREQGLMAYFKSWIPGGVEGAAAGPLFVIEVISHFVRIISLSVRLFANMLAGHLLILFMAGGLAVLLGSAILGVITLPVALAFFLFEVLLIATLQAFIFAVLAAIYLGGATAAHH